MKTRHRKKNRYPLPDKTVLYSRKKHLEPVPEAGKRYHCFDDGKIRFSRHYIIEVSEVLGYMQFKKKYPELFKDYCEVSKDCYWLYSRNTDKFIVAEKGENDELGVFVRTKQGDWFGIGNLNNSGTLDVTGKNWKWLVDNINLFNYTDAEKQRLISENTI